MSLRFSALALAAALGCAGPALAGPTYTFSGTTTAAVPNADKLGIVSLTQTDLNSVDVLVHLFDTTLPAPAYGFINTGGKHTPFAFTLAGTETGVTASFVKPMTGSYMGGPSGTTGPFQFSLTTTNGSDTPYGTYGISIVSTAGNGSNQAYYGDLEFIVSRTSGLSTDDFITNASIASGSSGPAYFAADLTDTVNTGSVAWKTRDPVITPTPTPEPASMAVLGLSLAGLGLIRRRSKTAA